MPNPNPTTAEQNQNNDIRIEFGEGAFKPIGSNQSEMAENALKQAESKFPFNLVTEDSPARDIAFGNFTKGIGAALSDSPFAKGLEHNLIDLTIGTAGDTVFNWGQEAQESGRQRHAKMMSEHDDEDLVSPRSLFSIARAGGVPALMFSAGQILGDKAKAELAYKTDIDFAAQEVGLRLRKKADSLVRELNLEPEYHSLRDKLAYDIGSGAASILVAIGASMLGGPTTGAAYFGLVQKGQTFREMTREAKVLDLKSGKEIQIDFEGYRDNFDADALGAYADGQLSRDGKFKLIRAPMDARRAGAISTLAALPEAGLEFVGLHTIMRGLRGFKPVQRTILVAFEQALQEAAQQGGEEWIAKAFWGRAGSTADIRNRIGYAAFLGMILGLPTGAISTMSLFRSAKGQLMSEYQLSEEQADSLMERVTAKVIELGKEEADLFVTESVVPYGVNFPQEARDTAKEDAENRRDLKRAQMEFKLEPTEEDAAYGSKKKAQKAIQELINELQKKYGPSNIRRASAVSQLKRLSRVDFRGQNVSTPEQLAQLFQVFRSPSAEHFHWALLDEKGDIITHHAVTSGLVDEVALDNDTFTLIRQQIKETGAKQLVLMHNHPSGKVRMSEPDYKLTKKFKSYFPNEYQFHVVIDHGDFGYFDNELRFDSGKYKHDGEGNWMKNILGKISGPEGLSGFFSDVLRAKDALHVLFTDKGLNIVAYEVFNPMKTASELVRFVIEGKRRYGTSNYIFLGTDGALKKVSDEISLFQDNPESGENYPAGMLDIVRVEKDGTYHSYMEDSRPLSSERDGQQRADSVFDSESEYSKKDDLAMKRALIEALRGLKPFEAPVAAFHVLYGQMLTDAERAVIKNEVTWNSGRTSDIDVEEFLGLKFVDYWKGNVDSLRRTGGKIETFIRDAADQLRDYAKLSDSIEAKVQSAERERLRKINPAVELKEPNPESRDFSNEVNAIGEEVGRITNEDKAYIEARYELDHLEMVMEQVRDFRSSIGKIRKYPDGFLKEELARVPRRYVTKDKHARTLDEVATDLGYDSTDAVIDMMVKMEARAAEAKARIPELYDVIEPYEKLEKRRQKEVKQALEKRLPPSARGGIVPPELVFGAWKDKRQFMLSRETFERNLEDVVGKDQVDIVKQFASEKIKQNESRRAEFVSDMRVYVKGFLDRLGIKKGSLEDKLIMRFAEKRINEQELKTAAPKSWEKVLEASTLFRALYDQMLDQINDVRETFGYEPILKREDYMRHYIELGNILEEFGMIFEQEKLPTDIAGITYQFKPGKPFTTTEISRRGGKFKETAIGGFDNYIDAVSKQIFHTDSVQRVRVLDKYIRNFFAGTGDRRLSNFVTYLEEYANLLAAKQTMFDRGSETYIGRPFFKFFDWLRGVTSGAMIAGNISSALTNTIPFTQALATMDKQAFAKGLFEATITPFKRGQSFMVDGVRSELFARRYPLEKISQTWFEASKDTLGALFNSIDMFTAKTVISGKFYEGLKMGMDKEAAMKRADNYATKLLADRSMGQLPIIFRARTLGFITQFQVEANNIWSNILKDIPREYEDEAGKLFWALLQFVIYSHLYNNFFQFVSGRRPTIDPIYALLTLFGWSSKGKGRPFPQRMERAFSSIAQNLPFVNYILDGGRFPVFDVFPDLKGVLDDRKDLGVELTKFVTTLFPGGAQVRKTAQGLKEFFQGASYTSKAHRLRYMVEQTPANFIRAALFGRRAIKESQEYYDGYGVANSGVRISR